MRVAFQSNHFGLLGTEVAQYDYAHYNEEILNNESIIMTCKNYPGWPHNQTVVDKFHNRFKVFYYEHNNMTQINSILEQNKIDAFYSIRGGGIDFLTSTKNCIHAVFQTYQPHGEVYAYISEWLTNKMTNGSSPFVPHMVNLPNVKGDLREQLGIPKDAIVFGRYGNANSFNVPFVIEAINKIVSERNDTYFVFVNTKRKSPECRIPLSNDSKIILLPEIVSLEEKVKYINTCDAMVHARLNGESFGISIAEFSIKNKPIITWDGTNAQQYYQHAHDLAHVDMLGERGLFYSDYQTVYDTINNFKPQPEKDWNAYRDYLPEPVMNKFNEVFLK